MYLVYNETDLWRMVRYAKEAETFSRKILGPEDGAGIPPFDALLAAELDYNTIEPAAGNDCYIWGGPVQDREHRVMRPYISVARRPYPPIVPVRQAVVARYIKIHYIYLPRFRVSMACTSSRCIAIAHMIPTGIRSRLLQKDIARNTEISHADLEQARRDDLYVHALAIKEGQVDLTPYGERTDEVQRALNLQKTPTPEEQEALNHTIAEEYNRKKQWEDAAKKEHVDQEFLDYQRKLQEGQEAERKAALNRSATIEDIRKPRRPALTQEEIIAKATGKVPDTESPK